MNSHIPDQSRWRIIQRFFGRYLGDQRIESVLNERMGRIRRFSLMNYHFLGFLKKFSLFLVLVVLEENFTLQIYAIYAILGTWLLMGTDLRPFKSASLNFLRSLSDLVLVIYFLLVHLGDKLIRDLKNYAEWEKNQISVEQIQQIAEKQKRLGYAALSMQFLYCLINIILYALRTFY